MHRMEQGAPEPREERAARLFSQHQGQVWRRVDRLFAGLMVGQWLCAIAVALFFSPSAWEGKVHGGWDALPTAMWLGGVLSAIPLALVWLRPGAVLPRHGVALCQLLWSALFIHLTAGRLETHFHIFGSLVVLALYRDWPVLL